MALHRADPLWGHRIKELDRFLIGGIRHIHDGSLVGDIYSNYHAAKLHGYDALVTWETVLLATKDKQGLKHPVKAAKGLQKRIHMDLLARAFLPGYPFATPLCQHPTVEVRKRWELYFPLEWDRGVAEDIERWMQAVRMAAKLVPPKVSASNIRLGFHGWPPSGQVNNTPASCVAAMRIAFVICVAVASHDDGSPTYSWLKMLITPHACSSSPHPDVRVSFTPGLALPFSPSTMSLTTCATNGNCSPTVLCSSCMDTSGEGPLVAIAL